MGFESCGSAPNGGGSDDEDRKVVFVQYMKVTAPPETM